MFNYYLKATNFNKALQDLNEIMTFRRNLAISLFCLQKIGNFFRYIFQDVKEDMSSLLITNDFVFYSLQMFSFDEFGNLFSIRMILRDILIFRNIRLSPVEFEFRWGYFGFRSKRTLLMYPFGSFLRDTMIDASVFFFVLEPRLTIGYIGFQYFSAQLRFFLGPSYDYENQKVGLFYIFMYIFNRDSVFLSSMTKTPNNLLTYFNCSFIYKQASSMWIQYLYKNNTYELQLALIINLLIFLNISENYRFIFACIWHTHQKLIMILLNFFSCNIIIGFDIQTQSVVFSMGNSLVVRPDLANNFSDVKQLTASCFGK